MKKKFVLKIACMLSAVVSISSSVTVGAADARLNYMYQHPQERSYWCGYSAMQSVVQHEVALGNISGRASIYDSLSQTEIVDYMRDNYNVQGYDGDAFPWYSGGSSSSSARYQPNYYPARALNKITDNSSFSWAAYGTGITGNSKLYASDVKWRVRSTINNGHGVMVCGRSAAGAGEDSHIPGYPTNSSPVHWLAVDGYKDDGNQIWIIDPAANSSCAGLGNISRYYTLSIDKFTAFATYSGIVW